MRTVRGWSVVLAMVGASLACSKHASNPPVTPTPTTSFGLIQTRVFNTTCATTGCHSTSTHAGSMDLSEGHAYASLVGITPLNDDARADHLLRVWPGIAESSLIVHKLHADQGHHASRNYGARMPADRAAVPSGWLAYIEAWVNAGALDTGLVGDTTLLHDTLSMDVFIPPAPPTAGPPRAGRAADPFPPR